MKLKLHALIVDLLAYSKGTRLWTRDVIGSGPRTVGGVLEQRGINVDLMQGDYFLENSYLARNYDVLLISGMVTDIPITNKVISLWRKIQKNKPIIVGGPFSSYAERILRLGVDLVVIGEAETTLLELTKTSIFEEGKLVTEELYTLRGLVFRVNNKTIYTGPRPPLTSEELGKFKSSCRLASYYPGYWAYRFYVEVVRGCSNFLLSPIARELNKYYPGCAYCSVTSYWGPARSIPIERIVEEVKCLFDIGVNRIVLSAPDVLDYGRDWLSNNQKLATKPDDPPPNITALRNLFNEIYSKTGFSPDKNSLILENVKPINVNEETASLLGEFFKETPVNIGIESGDEKLTSKMGRPGDLSQAVNAVRLLRDNGLYPQVYLIYGLPEQDDISLKKTLDLLEVLAKNGAERIILYRFIPLPRTPLEDFKRKTVLSNMEVKLENEVKKLNSELKKHWIGKKILGIIVTKKKNLYVSYPLKHGPVIYTKDSFKTKKDLIGRVVKLLIRDILSERALMGEFLSIGKPVKKTSYWETLSMINKKL